MNRRAILPLLLAVALTAAACGGDTEPSDTNAAPPDTTVAAPNTTSDEPDEPAPSTTEAMTTTAVEPAGTWGVDPWEQSDCEDMEIYAQQTVVVTTCDDSWVAFPGTLDTRAVVWDSDDLSTVPLPNVTSFETFGFDPERDVAYIQITTTETDGIAETVDVGYWIVDTTTGEPLVNLGEFRPDFEVFDGRYVPEIDRVVFTSVQSLDYLTVDLATGAVEVVSPPFSLPPDPEGDGWPNVGSGFEIESTPILTLTWANATNRTMDGSANINLATGAVVDGPVVSSHGWAGRGNNPRVGAQNSTAFVPGETLPQETNGTEVTPSEVDDIWRQWGLRVVPESDQVSIAYLITSDATDVEGAPLGIPINRGEVDLLYVGEDRVLILDYPDNRLVWFDYTGEIITTRDLPTERNECASSWGEHPVVGCIGVNEAAGIVEVSFFGA